MTALHPLRVAGVFAILAGLFAQPGCQTVPDEREAAEEPASGVLVEAYPPPVDPVDTAEVPATPPPEPRIVDIGEKSTLVYPCRHVQSDVLKDVMTSFIGIEGTIEASRAMNVLLISDRKEVLSGMLDLLKEIDRPVAQLLVEARIVEVTLDSDLEYELQHLLTIPTRRGETPLDQTLDSNLETPGSTPNPTLGGLLNIRPWAHGSKRLDEFIRLLVTRGKAKILSSPNMIVAAGTEGSIITGEEVPIQSATVVSGSVSTTTQFKRVGIKLRVSPLQITSDTVLLDVNPEVSTVTGFTAAGASGISNPIVAIRNIRSTLSLKDNEILTIGGLLRSEDRSVVRKIPGLGDIPVLGLLFQSQRLQTVKTQLVFFLRVSILAEGKPRTLRMHTPGSGLNILDQEVERSAVEETPAVPDGR